MHDPGKIITDLAVSLALGGDCLADLGVLRGEPGVYGRVASDPTVSRAIAVLADDEPVVVKAIDVARAAARHQAWKLAGFDAPDYGSDATHPLIIDLDATLLTSHSEKENAAPTFKRGFGFHPLCAFLDHGADGTGEALAIRLRPGNAGSNTASDHITVIRQALAQLPGHRRGQRPGRKVLIRIDGGGGTKQLLAWLTGQRLAYSVGFTLPVNTRCPPWSSATGAAPAAKTGSGSRKTPDCGTCAQLRFDDVDGMRITAFATNTSRGQYPIRTVAVGLSLRAVGRLSTGWQCPDCHAVRGPLSTVASLLQSDSALSLEARNVALNYLGAAGGFAPVEHNRPMSTVPRVRGLHRGHCQRKAAPSGVRVANGAPAPRVEGSPSDLSAAPLLSPSSAATGWPNRHVSVTCWVNGCSGIGAGPAQRDDLGHGLTVRGV